MVFTICSFHCSVRICEAKTMEKMCIHICNAVHVSFVEVSKNNKSRIFFLSKKKLMGQTSTESQKITQHREDSSCHYCNVLISFAVGGAA